MISFLNFVLEATLSSPQPNEQHIGDDLEIKWDYNRHYGDEEFTWTPSTDLKPENENEEISEDNPPRYEFTRESTTTID